ncbi:MAG: bifunctional glutamate N-acetyltransferase/amino-acid acetyltransferase ArgJ [Candidatus Omnitrophica bacterium]|nr:bifunctional glutamate N-acetyltransferase/amino-acid acetyltransferase ArgJ [Candidatus Omnitrophota bacterium]
MKNIKGGVTAAKGFLANGLWCGIKKSGKPDLSLIFSNVPAVAAGVFTKNSIVAAPLVVTRKKIKSGWAQAIVTNSGNANCFTGKLGLVHAEKTSAMIAKLLNVAPNNVLVSSTGIIGKPLPYDKIAHASECLVNGLSPKKANIAAKGILTTDLATKEISVSLKLGGKQVKIGAMAKGSGMIAPNMATMLAYITTDAAISLPMLKVALKNACEQSFNSITIDNCMSTNDMVIVLANGLAQNKIINKNGKDFQAFQAALNYTCLDLAKRIVKDGEGATKFITVTVTGAKNYCQAKIAALAIANSNLVKTAAYGSNPNWGRVAAAVGSLALPVYEKQLKIKFSPFTKKDISISAHLGLGNACATVYTSDLSPKYVDINGKYN